MDPCILEGLLDPAEDDAPEWRLGMAPLRDVFRGMGEPNPFPGAGRFFGLRGMVIDFDWLLLLLLLPDLRRGIEPSKEEGFDFFFGILQLLFDPLPFLFWLGLSMLYLL